MAGVEMFPARYGNVAFVLVAYCFLNFWMGFQAGKARKKYNVPYPTLYVIESENKLQLKYGLLALMGLMGCSNSFGVSLLRGKPCPFFTWNTILHHS
ncbi:hypothetical protein SADUNF_Sadunf17G0128600 [Salix dunnii]|uniref:Uncharacterized protein n=1 Tax=Salix dunnii TaxID=1413687 RepID=A0A835J423_9ROSI|nr:hypothetical protein SADUNF_Sadunf17G0128600 [Salix dunnii]